MPVIGRLEYPEVSFSNALETVEAISSKSIKTVHGLAVELGYSTKSKSPGGTFYYKLVALDKLYGLIERSKGSLSLSPLGQRIAYPLNEDDKAAAIRESVGRVEILRLLFNDLGSSFSDGDFRPALKKLTGANPDQIAAQAVRVEGLYRDALKYLGSGAGWQDVQEGGPVAVSESSSPSESGAAPVASPPGHRPRGVGGVPQTLPIPVFEGAVRNLHSEDGYYIRIKLDTEVIEEAIAVLTALKGRVPPRETK
jgi:hypothetical protein